MRRTLLLALTVGFLVSTLGPVTASAQEDGAALLEQRCSVCHPAARPKAAKKTPEQWETTVSRMMGKGAKLSEVEKKNLLAHLGNTYKP